MTVLTIEEAQAKLPELVEGLAAAEEIILTRDGRPVAKLVGEPSSTGRPILGRGRGKLIIVSEDDDHLQDFEEYM